jgi:hypothetical protein
MTTITLDRLESITRYPSIQTYHALDRGAPTEEVQVPFTPDDDVIITEKIDGTNARLIFTGPELWVQNKHGHTARDQWILGSRSELLTCHTDFMATDKLGIVDTLTELASDWQFAGVAQPEDDLAISVFYFEVYGGKVTAASKQYTGSQQLGYRLFDIMLLRDASDLADWPAQQVASWRDNGGQRFANESVLKTTTPPLTPRLSTGTGFVGSVEHTRGWLEEWRQTRAALDTAAGQSEGVVVRTRDRSKIAKIKFRDYAKRNRERKPART